MADLPLAELEMRILLLPPISRGAHLDGARLHAERLVELWKVDDDDRVPMAQGWRLLGAETVAGAILRVMVMGDKDYSGDPRVWRFPGLENLLPELHACIWQAMCSGTLQVKGIRDVRGKDYDEVLPVELPRLVPDWMLSRLTFGGRDELIGVQVWRAPSTLAATEAADTAAFAGELIAAGTMVAVEAADSAAFVGGGVTRPANRPWSGEKLSTVEQRAAMKTIEQGYPPGAHPSEKEVWEKLETHWRRKITRATVRSALKGSRLKGRRGHQSTKSPPT